VFFQDATLLYRPVASTMFKLT